MKMTKKQPTIEEIIQMTVVATCMVTGKQPKEIFKATERRLYAYPVIKLKIADDRERINDIRSNGTGGKSKSIVRYRKSGIRLTEEEIAETLIHDINADIAGNESEIERIDKAIAIIAADQYADIVRYKYFEGKSDDEIAELMPCDPSTVRRNKSRLVGRMSVYLYGINAVP